MLSMVGAGLHQRYTYLVCGRLIYARDGKPEREMVWREGDNSANCGGAEFAQLDPAGSRTRSEDYFSLSTGVERVGCRGVACSIPTPTR